MDLFTASVSELKQLKRIGESTANKIKLYVQKCEEGNADWCLDQLLSVSGIDLCHWQEWHLSGQIVFSFSSMDLERLGAVHRSEEVGEYGRTDSGHGRTDSGQANSSLEQETLSRFEMGQSRMLDLLESMEARFAGRFAEQTQHTKYLEGRTKELEEALMSRQEGPEAVLQRNVDTESLQKQLDEMKDREQHTGELFRNTFFGLKDHVERSCAAFEHRNDQDAPRYGEGRGLSSSGMYQGFGAAKFPGGTASDHKDVKEEVFLKHSGSTVFGEQDVRSSLVRMCDRRNVQTEKQLDKLDQVGAQRGRGDNRKPEREISSGSRSRQGRGNFTGGTSGERNCGPKKRVSVSSRNGDYRGKDAGSGSSADEAERDQSPPFNSSDEGSDKGSQSLNREQSVRRGSDQIRSVRRRSPPPPRIATFHGELSKFQSFMYQFEEMVRAHEWDREKRLQNLKLSLRDKAIEFFHSRPKEVKNSYKLLTAALKERYGQKDPPFTVRRQLSIIKQEEDESLEDFGDRLLTLTNEGYPEATEETLQMLAVDAFFRGCKEKAAVVLALEKEPKSMHAAVQAVKKSLHNQKLMGKPSYLTRHVSFEDFTGEPAVRNLSSQEGRPDKQLEKAVQEISVKVSENFDRMIAKLPYLFEGSQATGGSTLAINQASTERPSSPGRLSGCFKCGKPGHMMRDCRSSSPARPITCQLCDKVGHVAKDCYSLKKESVTPPKVTCQLCGIPGHIAKTCRILSSGDPAKRLFGDTTSPSRNVAASPVKLALKE